MISLRELHQVELSSHCNLRCQYCPSRHLPRPKLYMSETHFIQALAWVQVFKQRGWQKELNLAGIGESTMHPDFAKYVGLARHALGDDFGLVFATNGLLVTEELVKAIAPYKPVVFVSLHRPERAKLAIDILADYGLIAGVSADPSVAATNWAGQVKWRVTAPMHRPCQWVRGGKAFMFADGRLSRCAYDASGVGVFGTIDDDLDKLTTSPYQLCRTCDQDVGIPLENVDAA